MVRFRLPLWILMANFYVMENFRTTLVQATDLIRVSHLHHLADDCNFSIRETSPDIELSYRQDSSPLRSARLRMEMDKETGIETLLNAIIKKDMDQCHLVLGYDTKEDDSDLETLIQMPNLKQIIRVTSYRDFHSIGWKSSSCQGYIFLLRNPSKLITFAEEAEEPWDYHGKYVLVGFSKDELNTMASTKKGKKTQHIISLTQTSNNEWQIYMNQLYWGDDVTLVNWWRGGGFTSNNRIFPDKTSNLRGANITLITFEFAPHVIYAHKEGDEPFGRDLRVAFALSKILNFTLRLQEPPPGELWGGKFPNGTWNGLVGSLARNIGHIGMANTFLSNNNDRIKVQGFTRAYDADVSCFMARTDPPLPRWQSLALPFQMDTWLAILIGLLIFCPLLYSIGRLSSLTKYEVPVLGRLTTSTLYTWGMQFRQSQAQVPLGSPTQILVIFLWMYVIIVTTGYSSNLTAFLTVVRQPASIETIKELHASDHDVLGMGYFFKTSLASSGNVHIKGLTERYHGLSDFKDTYSPLKKGSAVFLESRKYLEYLIGTKFTDHGIPNMRILKECYAPYSIAIATQKHFPLQRSFDRAIAWISESGLVRRWFLRTLLINKQARTDGDGSQDEKSEGKNRKGAIPLGIDHMQGLFFILLLGLTFSAMAFVTEVFCSKGS